MNLNILSRDALAQKIAALLHVQMRMVESPRLLHELQAQKLELEEQNRVLREAQVAWKSEAKRARLSEQRLRAQLERVDRAVFAVRRVLEQHRPEVVTPVFQAIVDEARKLTGASQSALELDASPDMPEAWIESGGPVTIDPSDGERGRFLAQPVRYANSTFGRLYLQQTQDRAPFSEDERLDIERFAERIGFAIEIARLEGAATRERERTRLLISVSEQLASVLSPESLRESVIMVSDSLLTEACDFCLVWFKEGQAVQLWGAAHVQPEKHTVLRQAQTTEAMSSGLAELERLSRTERPVLLSDRRASGHGLLEREQMLSELDTRSALLVPLIAHRQVVGGLVLGYTDSGRRYSVQDISFAQAVALPCALARDRARLYQHAQSALKARENLLAVVSHDMQTPLNAITLSARMLSRPDGEGERRRTSRQVETISRSAQLMSHMVDHLLTATAIEHGRLNLQRRDHDAVALMQEAHDMAEPLAFARDVQLTKEARVPLPDVRCDRERVLQVFSNLVGNALKFTPPGGTVTLAVRSGEEGVLRFSVTDTGPGIPLHQQALVFDRYWKSGSQGGLGLGLFIAKSIVEAHGCRIWLESNDRGTSFFFTLPAAVRYGVEKAGP